MNHICNINYLIVTECEASEWLESGDILCALGKQSESKVCCNENTTTNAITT